MSIGSSISRIGRAQLLALVLGTLIAIAGTAILMAGPAREVQQGGPVVLMGIDAEDGGLGGHGPISNYEQLVNSVYGQASNGGSGILVVGGGKDPSDHVTSFWNAIASGTGQSVTYVNGASNITSQSFSGFKMIAVVSDNVETTSGGLTSSENDALTGRQQDVADFVNGGGGLLGFSSEFGSMAYGYLGGVGAFTVNTGLFYDQIDPTQDGLNIGITDDLDVCCWHDEYLTYPGFLKVLATNATTGNAAAIGGANVIVEPACTFGEILPPVNDVSDATDAGMSSYKFGSRGVIPAKFRVTCDNDPIDTQAEADAHPMTLTLTKLGSTPAEDSVVEQTQTGSANTGNLFRFVDADDHYIYNIGVKGLEAGTYKLTISEAGGGSHDEWFSIK